MNVLKNQKNVHPVEKIKVLQNIIKKNNDELKKLVKLELSDVNISVCYEEMEEMKNEKKDCVSKSESIRKKLSQLKKKKRVNKSEQ